jgi:hypothetical protein
MGGGSSDDRRLKAALFLILCLAAGLLPHALGPLARLLPSLGLAGLLGAYAVRTVFLRPRSLEIPDGAAGRPSASSPSTEPLVLSDPLAPSPLPATAGLPLLPDSKPLNRCRPSMWWSPPATSRL